MVSSRASHLTVSLTRDVIQKGDGWGALPAAVFPLKAQGLKSKVKSSQKVYLYYYEYHRNADGLKYYTWKLDHYY